MLKNIIKPILNDIFWSYKEFWIKATQFNGKTKRKEWWWVQLVNLIIYLLTIPIFSRTYGFNVFRLICIIPQLAIDVRRIRDFGKSWKWIFINLIPIVGSILWFFWLGFGDSASKGGKFSKI